MKGGNWIRLLFNFQLLFSSISANQIPTWITQFPHDPDEYIGIGRASKKEFPTNYREKAQLSALTQLSREISIQIYSENKFTEVETDIDKSQKFTQRLSSSTTNHLVDYKLSNSYENEFEYYAMYTLNKAEYHRYLETQESTFNQWLQGECESIKLKLKHYEIETAINQFSSSQKKYQEFYDTQNMRHPQSDSTSKVFQQLMEKISSLMTDTHFSNSHVKLKLISSFDQKFVLTHPKLFSLSSADSPEAWKGAFTFNLINLSIPNADTCTIKTDQDGDFDLDILSTQCHLKNGSWKLVWTSLGNEKVLGVTIEVIPLVVDLKINIDSRIQSGFVKKEIQSDLEKEVKNYHSESFIFSELKPNSLKVVLNLNQINLDSLDGFYFVQLRGSVEIGSGKNFQTIIGKSGYPNKIRALRAAEKDFIRALSASFLDNIHYQVNASAAE